LQEEVTFSEKIKPEDDEDFSVPQLKLADEEEFEPEEDDEA